MTMWSGLVKAGMATRGGFEGFVSQPRVCGTLYIYRMQDTENPMCYRSFDFETTPQVRKEKSSLVVDTLIWVAAE